MKRNERQGHAMLETVILIVCVALVVGFALRGLGSAFSSREIALRTYYAQPGP